MQNKIIKVFQDVNLEFKILVLLTFKYIIDQEKSLNKYVLINQSLLIVIFKRFILDLKV